METSRLVARRSTARLDRHGGAPQDGPTDGHPDPTNDGSRRAVAPPVRRRSNLERQRAGLQSSAATLVAVVSDGNAGRLFSDEFDDEFPAGPQEGNRAFFGQNVLRSLVDGVDEFIHRPNRRWHRYRSDGPALLGSSMWIDDEQLIDKSAELSAACIVVSK
jgi:hypothetical protein